MTTTPQLSDGTTIETHDHPYQRVASTAPSLAQALRNVGDWLDVAEKAIGEAPFVASTELTVDEEGHQFSIFVHADEFAAVQAATGPKLSKD